MKKLFAILFTVVLTSSFAFAQFNPHVTAFAKFDANVIAPLKWTVPVTSMTLPVGIAGQHRTGITGKSLDFVLTGEAGENVTITTHIDLNGGNGEGTDTDAQNPTTDPVTLDCTWSQVDGNVVLTGGTLTEKFSVTGINAKEGAHGLYQWTISVDAQYTSL